jgi:hypothetical protein
MVTSGALTTVLGKQRRVILVGIAVAVAGVWIAAPLGRWQAGVFFAVGVALSFLNHVLTELALYRALDRGAELTRKQFAMGSMSRLMLVTVIALAIVVVFWPDGAAVLFGLALFHLVILVFTGLPLLNEIRKA